MWLTVSAACASWRPAREPMPTVFYPAVAPPAHCLVVLLPGRGDKARDFASHGFLDLLRVERPGIDAVAADAHMGYFRAGTMLERLRDDVVGPARRRGYREVWLVGVSAGGTAAVLYDGLHPGEVAGLFLVAPFMGSREIVGGVAAAGGPDAWVPAAAPGENFEVDLWRWVKERAASPRALARVFLGYGTDDRFSYGHRLLADSLPADRVLTAAGGHDWATWRELWRSFLRSDALASCARGVPDPESRTECRKDSPDDGGGGVGGDNPDSRLDIVRQRYRYRSCVAEAAPRERTVS